MEKIKEDVITKIIKEQLKEDERFKEVHFGCKSDYYVISQIKLNPEVSALYEQLLDVRANAGIIKKGTDYMDGSTAGYSKDMQLMNGKNAHIHIAFYRSFANILAKYEDENINLKTDENEAKQIGTELILPEFKNILDIMNRGKEKEESQR